MKTSLPPDESTALRIGHSLHDAVVLAGRHLRHLRRTPEKIVTGTLTPGVIAVALGYLFGDIMSTDSVGDYTSFIMAGVLAQVVLTGVGTTALGVISDVNNGITDRFQSLPISRSSVLIGHTLADTVVLAVNLAVVSLIGLAIGWRFSPDLSNLLLAYGLLLLFGYACLWIGVVLGLVLRTYDTVNSVSGLVLVLFSFLSTSFIPLTALPGALSVPAAWNPVSPLVTLFRDLLGTTDPHGGTALPVQHPLPILLAWIAVMLLVLVPLGIRLHKRAATR